MRGQGKPMSGYPVPVGETRVEYRHGNSLFIATLAPAATIVEARAFIRRIRAEMPDATHHVYAMRAGHGASVTEGMSDDGEPSGTSGPPVLAVLRGSNLGDAVLVVTRYYGGTKLGTGGLVQAYGNAARAVIAAAPTEEKVLRRTVTFAMAYAHYEFAIRLMREHNGIIDGESFADHVELVVRLPVDTMQAVVDKLTDHCAGRVEISHPEQEG
jgi:uncharacterized YigZ family protein